MSQKRSTNIMLRLTPDEHEAIVASKPPGEELAVFARRTLLSAVHGGAHDPLRRAAAFVVAVLSPDIKFDEALSLYDENAGSREEVARDRE